MNLNIRKTSTVIKKPSTKDFTSLVTQARKFAKKVGLNKRSIKNAIKEACE